MHAESALPTDLTRSYSATLAEALAWLGHDCPGGCPRGATEMSSRMRFLHLPGAEPPFRTHTVVVVDPEEVPWTATQLHGWLHDVNHCVRRDHIVVRTRAARTVPDRPTRAADVSAGTVVQVAGRV